MALLLPLAGCGSQSNPAHVPGPALAAPEIPEEYGILEGLVLDDQFLPVPGVLLKIADLERSSVSNTEGLFRFDYVRPGTHTLEATLLDFEPVLTQFALREGETVSLLVSVTFPPVNRPHWTTQIENGYFACNALGNECPGVDQANTRRVFEIDLASDTITLLTEVSWRPTALGSETSRFHAWLYYQEEPSPRLHVNSGAPYLRMTAGPSALHNITEPGLRLDMRTDLLHVNYYAPGIATEQPFTVYLTQFHLEDRSEGFSALPAT